MAIWHCYWHLVVNNGNFILLLISSDQEWQFFIATDMQWSRLAISHSYWHLVGLSFLIRNKRALWRKSKTWNIELKFGRWTYFGCCPPPMWNCQRKEQALCISIPSMRAHLKQSNWQENDRWCPPPTWNCQRKDQALCIHMLSMRAPFETVNL